MEEMWKLFSKGDFNWELCARNFIAMAQIGNVTQNNKIRLIAGNSSEMVWCLHASVLFIGQTLLAEQYLAFSCVSA